MYQQTNVRQRVSVGQKALSFRVVFTDITNYESVTVRGIGHTNLSFSDAAVSKHNGHPLYVNCKHQHV